MLYLKVLKSYNNKQYNFFSTNTVINSTLKYAKNFNNYLKVERKQVGKKLKVLWFFLKFKKKKIKRAKKKFLFKVKDTRVDNKRKVKKTKESKYLVYIESNYHNIQIFVNNEFGDCLFWINGGAAGYKGRKKGSPFVGRVISDLIIKKFKGLKPEKTFSFFFKGFGPARKIAIQRFKRKYRYISKIHKLSDITPIPHNGCRKKKKKRK